jgi:molybdopterin-guanine dinucleotide biosynthesis protein B
MAYFPLPVFGFAAPSGTGKTRLLRQMIPLLRQRGLRIGLVKHTHHDFELDTPGKDSYELRQAGAGQVLLASQHRWALIMERSPPCDPPLAQLLKRLDADALDLVLVEGFRRAPIPKIELYRSALGRLPQYPGDPYVIAVATDGDLPVPTDLPCFDLNDPLSLVRFVAQLVAFPQSFSKPEPPQ